MRIRNRTGDAFRSYIIVTPDTLTTTVALTMNQLLKFTLMTTETTISEVMSKYIRARSPVFFTIINPSSNSSKHKLDIRILIDFHVK